jgi:hypothetical protein
MSRRLPIALAVVGVLLIGSASAASAAIKISKIQYDSPGTDDGSNSSLNQEFVVLKNTGNRRVSLEGWVLKDVANHRYTFGSFRLRAGKSVKIHTGSGNDDRNDLFQDSGAYIWNNDGDTATLNDEGGSRVDRCRYAGGETSVDC